MKFLYSISTYIKTFISTYITGHMRTCILCGQPTYSKEAKRLFKAIVISIDNRLFNNAKALLDEVDLLIGSDSPRSEENRIMVSFLEKNQKETK